MLRSEKFKLDAQYREEILNINIVQKSGMMLGALDLEASMNTIFSSHSKLLNAAKKNSSTIIESDNFQTHTHTGRTTPCM